PAARAAAAVTARRREEAALALLRRADASGVYLPVEEVEPWGRDLVTRLEPLLADAGEVQSDGAGDGPAAEVREAFDQVTRAMAAALLDGARRARLAEALQAYRARLAVGGEAEAAAGAEAASQVVQMAGKPAENPFLLLLCRLSLQAYLRWAEEQERRPPPYEPTGYDPARVALLQPLRAAIEALGLPLKRRRKLDSILNALTMQVEDGGDSAEVNLLLLEALRAGIRHQVGEEAGAAALQAAAAWVEADARH
ncbi:MAG: hypothetical protein ACUVX9_05800, partial [Anaerolineae bacterium]